MKSESTHFLILESIMSKSARVHRSLAKKLFLSERKSVSCACHCDVYVWWYSISIKTTKQSLVEIFDFNFFISLPISIVRAAWEMTSVCEIRYFERNIVLTFPFNLVRTIRWIVSFQWASRGQGAVFHIELSVSRFSSGVTWETLHSPLLVSSWENGRS